MRCLSAALSHLGCQRRLPPTPARALSGAAFELSAQELSESELLWALGVHAPPHAAVGGKRFVEAGGFGTGMLELVAGTGFAILLFWAV
mmetsp:Transcript_16946/g.27074  ORF Transcript_16946/g.27074 Transcript_16946/m.27074 type:complete len:89 (-) Transcript_16946:10-276(-)